MMRIITDRQIIKEYITEFINLVEGSVCYTNSGYTIGQIPEGRGVNGDGVLRHHIFLGKYENEEQQNLLEINIPYEYTGNIGAIRGRIAIDGDGNNHYILRSTIRMTTAGRVNIQYQVEDRLANRLVRMGGICWIKVCNIDAFDINEVITVLDVIQSCRDGVFFQNIPGEIINHNTITEGAKQTITVNRYERDAGAKKQCLERWGVNCCICNFDFGKRYGDYGAGYIHVHHLKPLSEIGQEYELNPFDDLRPICPNCHSMIHRSTPALTIDELKKLFE